VLILTSEVEQAVLLGNTRRFVGLTSDPLPARTNDRLYAVILLDAPHRSPG
jgi:hypothetical protein